MEKHFQTAFSHWLKANNPATAVYELKICHTDKLPLSAVKEHQITALFEAEQQNFYHKISDSSFGLKPFDCLFMSQPNAYVAILWYTPRSRKTVTLIRIRDFIALKDDKTPSLALSKARLIAEKVFELGS